MPLVEATHNLVGSEFLGREVLVLYPHVDWADLLRGVEIGSHYNGFRTESLVAAHMLPYILPIPSERALAEELAEREILQELCGFVENGGDDYRITPSRATLWHFRRRHPRAFPELILKGLASLAFLSSRRGIMLPSASSQIESSGATSVTHFRSSKLAISGVIRTFGPVTSPSTNVDQLEIAFPDDRSRFAQTSQYVYKRKELLGDSIRFPVEIQYTKGGIEVDRVVLEKPGWLYSDLWLKDRPMGVGRSRRLPYVACNVAVIRRHEGTMQVLMAKRLAGSGAGFYALPGGKKKPHESVRKCAERELREETGLRLDADTAKPISLDYTEFPGFPRVKSVGVLARDWFGVPVRKEIHQHSSWEWYALEELPKLIFEPSRLVLEALQTGTLVELTWDDVEDPLPLWSHSRV